MSKRINSLSDIPQDAPWKGSGPKEQEPCGDCEKEGRECDHDESDFCPD